MVTENGVNHTCQLRANANAGFELTVNGKDQLTVSDSFTLFDEVLNARVNDNDLTLQLTHTMHLAFHCSSPVFSRGCCSGTSFETNHFRA